VTFVHVTPPEEVRGGRGGAHALTHEEEVDESETALEAADAAGVSYALERFSGETAETIVALAETKNADLIALGCRGRNPIASALLGSVSQGVLRNASRPVLVVKGAKAPAETTA
jgi:nucleotide-binding universal stress UspA family protein